MERRRKKKKLKKHPHTTKDLLLKMKRRRKRDQNTNIVIKGTAKGIMNITIIMIKGSTIGTIVITNTTDGKNMNAEGDMRKNMGAIIAIMNPGIVSDTKGTEIGKKIDITETTKIATGRKTETIKIATNIKKNL